MYSLLYLIVFQKGKKFLLRGPNMKYFIYYFAIVLWRELSRQKYVRKYNKNPQKKFR